MHLLGAFLVVLHYASDRRRAKHWYGLRQQQPAAVVGRHYRHLAVIHFITATQSHPSCHRIWIRSQCACRNDRRFHIPWLSW